MKKCAAGLAALFLIVIFLSPRAFAAGYELPEGTSITAQSAYFVNLDTGIVVFEQNADEQRSVASLTKLMTALLLMENVRYARAGREAIVALQEDGSVRMIRRAETPKDYFATFDFCDILKNVKE